MSGEVMLITREHAFRAAQNAVRNQGYAVALHGSQVRDLDLLAVPWQETAITAEMCAEIIAAAIPGVLLRPPEEKPYGRMAWEIHPLRSAGHKWGHGFDQWYIDLSVMPRDPAVDAVVVERARIAGAAWFAEHGDGASADDEWRDHYRAVLEASLRGRSEAS